VCTPGLARGLEFLHFSTLFRRLDYTERGKLPRSVSGHGFSRAATGRLSSHGALAPDQVAKAGSINCPRTGMAEAMP
jgi:hypothetical protein